MKEKRWLYFYHAFTYLQGPKGYPTWYSGIADMARPIVDDESFQELRAVIANASAAGNVDPRRIVVQACTPMPQGAETGSS